MRNQMRTTARVLAGMALLATASAGYAAEPSKAPSAPTPPAPVKAAAPQVPYHPSEFSGVMVRNVPAPATAAVPQAPAAGQVYPMPPGVTPPPAAPRQRGTQNIVLRVERTNVMGGGIVATLDPSFAPYAVAQVTPSGKVVVRCSDGDEIARVAPAAGKAAPKAQRSVKKAAAKAPVKPAKAAAAHSRH